jgi:hypothetical protein
VGRNLPIADLDFDVRERWVIEVGTTIALPRSVPVDGTAWKMTYRGSFEDCVPNIVRVDDGLDRVKSARLDFRGVKVKDIEGGTVGRCAKIDKVVKKGR